MQIDAQELYIQALERAAKADNRFKVVKNPLDPEFFTYLDPETGKPELNPLGSTAEHSFAIAYNLSPKWES